MFIEKFLINGEERFRIVNDENPAIVINDAQGFGFKTYEKALSFIEGRKVTPQREASVCITSIPLF